MIVIAHRYLWPAEYPYAVMLRDIVDACDHQYDGEVRVLSTWDGSEEQRQLRSEWAADRFSIDALRLPIERNLSLPRKALNTLLYSLWLFFKLVRIRPAVVMVATTPPVFAAMLVRWACKLGGSNYVYHCQDLHPESMERNGVISRGLLYRLLLAIDRKNIDAAAAVVVLSEDMKRCLAKRGNRTAHVRIINNFIFEQTDLRARDESQAVCKILFAGTMGRFQNLERVMEAIARFKGRDDVSFTFMGAGLLAGELASTADSKGLDNVFFVAQKPVTEAVQAMAEADYGLVSLSPGIVEVAYPSKTMMYMGQGLPVLAFVDADSELVTMINSHELGVAAGVESIDAMVKGIEMAIRKHREASIDREAVRAYASQQFGKEKVLSEMVTCLTEAAA